MPTKQYKIKYTVDDSQPKAAYKRGEKGFAGIEAAAEKAAAAAGRAFAAAGNAGVQAAAKQTAAAVKGSKARAAAADEEHQRIDVGLHKLQVTGIRFQDDRRKKSEQTAEAVVRAEANAARRLESLQKGAYGRLAEFQRRTLNDHQVQAVAVNKVIDVSNKKRIDHAMKLMGQERDAFAEGIIQAFGLSKAVTGVGAALVGIEVGQKVLAGVVSVFAEAKAKADEFARATLDSYKNLKALASVAGRDADGKFGSEVYDFGVKTGMTPQESREFQESFLGRSQIIKGKNISDNAFANYMADAGEMAAGKGVPGDVGGDLFGGVLKTKDYTKDAAGKARTDAEQSAAALADAAGAVKILDAGTGKMPILGPQMNKLLASMTDEDELKGRFRSAPEAAVAVSTAAEYDPGEAATMVQRTDDGLRQFGKKAKKQFFEESGITSADDFFTSIRKTNKLIDAKVKGGMPVDEAIKDMGFTEKREVRGLKTFYLNKDKIMEPQLANLSAATPEAAQTTLRDLRKQKTHQDAVSLARIEKEKFERGKRSEDLTIGAQNATAALTKEGLFDTSAGTFKRRAAGVFGMGADGDRSLADARALDEARRRAGVKPSPFGTPLDAVRTLGAGAATAEPLAAAMQSLFGNSAGELKRLTAAIEHSNRLAEAKQKAVPNAPGQLAIGPAPRGPMRP